MTSGEPHREGANHQAEPGLGPADAEPSSKAGRPLTPDDDTASADSFFQAFPVHLDAGLTVDRMIVEMAPWNSPVVFGAAGEGPAGPAMLMVVEWPVPWARTASPLPKRDLEGLHIQRFAADAMLATRRNPFDKLLPGADPPDFVVVSGDQSMGIECTSFAAESRRGAHALFAKLRQAAAETPRRFQHLAGSLVHVWFADGDRVGRPHASRDLPALEELLNLLAAHRPDPSKLRMDFAEGIPEVAPDLGIERTEAGASFYSVPISGAAPGSLLFAVAGFELSLSFSTTHPAVELESELNRLVASHDQLGVGVLLLTAGGPDRNGLIYPCEEPLAQFAVDQGVEIAEPRHIEQVILHSWGRGQAWNLYPKLEPSWGPHYQGLALSHQPIVLPSDEARPDGQAT